MRRKPLLLIEPVRQDHGRQVVLIPLVSMTQTLTPIELWSQLWDSMRDPGFGELSSQIRTVLRVNKYEIVLLLPPTG